MESATLVDAAFPLNTRAADRFGRYSSNTASPVRRQTERIGRFSSHRPPPFAQPLVDAYRYIPHKQKNEKKQRRSRSIRKCIIMGSILCLRPRFFAQNQSFAKNRLGQNPDYSTTIFSIETQPTQPDCIHSRNHSADSSWYREPPSLAVPPHPTHITG